MHVKYKLYILNNCFSVPLKIFPCNVANKKQGPPTQTCSCDRAGVVMQATAPLPWRHVTMTMRCHRPVTMAVWCCWRCCLRSCAVLCYNVCALFLCLQGYESSLLKITGKLTKNLCVSRERMRVHEARRSTPYTRVTHECLFYTCHHLFAGLWRITFKSHRQKWQKHISKYLYPTAVSSWLVLHSGG